MPNTMPFVIKYYSLMAELKLTFFFTILLIFNLLYSGGTQSKKDMTVTQRESQEKRRRLTAPMTFFYCTLRPIM